MLHCLTSSKVLITEQERNWKVDLRKIKQNFRSSGYNNYLKTSQKAEIHVLGF